MRGRRRVDPQRTSDKNLYALHSVTKNISKTTRNVRSLLASLFAVSPREPGFPVTSLQALQSLSNLHVFANSDPSTKAGLPRRWPPHPFYVRSGPRLLLLETALKGELGGVGKASLNARYFAGGHQRGGATGG